MLHCSTNKHFCHSSLLLPRFLWNSVSINFYLPRFIKLQFNGTNMFPLIYLQSSGWLWAASCLCSLVIGCLNPVKVSGLHPKVWAGWCHESGIIGYSQILIKYFSSISLNIFSFDSTISNLPLSPGLTGSCTAAGWRARWWTPATARTWRRGPAWPEVSRVEIQYSTVQYSTVQCGQSWAECG